MQASNINVGMSVRVSVFSWKDYISSHFREFKVQQKERSSQLVESEGWEVKIVALHKELAPCILFVNKFLFTFISQRQKQ